MTLPTDRPTTPDPLPGLSPGRSQPARRGHPALSSRRSFVAALLSRVTAVRAGNQLLTTCQPHRVTPTALFNAAAVAVAATVFVTASAAMFVVSPAPFPPRCLSQLSREQGVGRKQRRGCVSLLGFRRYKGAGQGSETEDRGAGTSGRGSGTCPPHPRRRSAEQKRLLKALRNCPRYQSRCADGGIRWSAAARQRAGECARGGLLGAPGRPWPRRRGLVLWGLRRLVFVLDPYFRPSVGLISDPLTNPDLSSGLWPNWPQFSVRRAGIDS